MSRVFSEKELAILAIVQKDLPDSLAPFADIAATAGTTEEDVLKFLEGLKLSGVIRRFGASIRHQRTDWKHNAMVAWVASEKDAEICGPIAAADKAISHVYYRPSSALDWPYTLYTMLHGRSEAECLEAVERLRSAWTLKDYAILRTLRELKKTSMTYFGQAKNCL